MMFSYKVVGAQLLALDVMLCFTACSLADEPPDTFNNSGTASVYGATLSPHIPEGAVVVPSADGALAAAINSNGTDTTFFIESGVHTGNSDMRLKKGAVLIGESGAVIDGGNTAKHCFIHDMGAIPHSADAPRYVVTLRNLVIRNYVPADQNCAVMAQDTGQGWQAVLVDPGDRNGWLVEHCTFESNAAGGLFLGSASTARYCLFSNNAQVGVKATGSGVQLLHSRSTGNNPNRKFNYFVEAGGAKFWNVRNLLLEGGEYDRNGGMGIWFDYVWDGNITRGARVYDNMRAGISVEMAVGVEVVGCMLTNNDTDGINGMIPAAFRPWDNSTKSGSDLWTGEVFLFNPTAAGTFVDPTTQASFSFSGTTRIHGNTISRGNGGIICLYQDRAGINPIAQMQGSGNGPVAGLRGTVIENNDIACGAGYAAAIAVLVNRDYPDASGSWGPIPTDQAREEYEGVQFRANRYADVVRFSVPKAATMGGSTNIWDWNNRSEVDLSRWQTLIHPFPDTSPAASCPHCGAN